MSGRRWGAWLREVFGDGDGMVWSPPAWCVLVRVDGVIVSHDFALLTCDLEMVPYYGGLGWQEVPARLVFEQPGGEMENDGAVMVWTCGRDPWPAGEIDLCGLPW